MIDIGMIDEKSKFKLNKKYKNNKEFFYTVKSKARLKHQFFLLL